MKHAALVVLNAKYSCDEYCDLLGVKDDGDKIAEMLSDHDYKVTLLSLLKFKS